MLYAIVDIETTGSYAAGNGITEIAIVIHDGKEVLDFYETLVNPGQPIPYFIQNLTGINEAMVAHAPSFEQVAPKLFEMMQGTNSTQRSFAPFASAARSCPVFMDTASVNFATSSIST